MATLDELIDEQNRIAAELQRMQDDPEATEEGSGNLRDTLIRRWEEIEPQRTQLTGELERLNIIRKRAAEDATVTAENGDGGNGNVVARFGGRSPEFMQRLDPFADREQTRDYLLLEDGDVIARAQNVVEAHDRRHLLPGDNGETASVSAQQPNIARHMLRTGSDDYLNAFRQYLNDPQGQGQVARTQLLTSTATAGYLLPYVLDSQLVLSNSGSVNPYRRIASVKQTTSNAWQGVNTAGVGVAWLAEGAQAADTGSAIAQIQIVPQKAAAWVTGSFEAMSDTDYASQLPGLLDDAKYVLEEQAFAVGTGGGSGPSQGQPLGIAMALSGTQRVAPTAVGTAGGAFFGTAGVADVYNLNAALGPRFRLSDSVSWVANITTINRIRSLDNYGGSSFWANLGSGQPERLLDKGIYESPSMLSPGTGGGTAVGSAVAIFGDFSKMYVIDRVGSTMLFDPMLKGAGTGNIPTGTQGWFYYWRVGAGVATQNAFRWLSNG